MLSISVAGFLLRLNLWPPVNLQKVSVFADGLLRGSLFPQVSKMIPPLASVSCSGSEGLCLQVRCLQCAQPITCLLCLLVALQSHADCIPHLQASRQYASWPFSWVFSPVCPGPLAFLLQYVNKQKKMKSPGHHGQDCLITSAWMDSVRTENDGVSSSLMAFYTEGRKWLWSLTSEGRNMINISMFWIWWQQHSCCAASSHLLTTARKHLGTEDTSCWTF